MKILAKTKDLSHEEWLKYRTQGIGGSDVSILAGINPFKSVHQLWLEKTGQVELEEGDTEYTHFGTLLEPIVRKEFTARTGIKVRQKHMILQSEEYPFMTANLDGTINDNGEMAIFEAKTASAFKQDIWEDGIPAPYILQIQHYMAVTGAKKVKTETELSKTSVSTATLALKVAEEELGTLKDKKVLIIGATGKIGGIVLMNIQSLHQADI